MDTAWDLAIVGSGSAAFSAAIRARDLGASVVMIEQSTIGGTCVNVGCVPSKALIRAGELQHLATHSSLAGMHTSARPIDLHGLIEQKDELVAQLRSEKYDDLLIGYGIDLVRGTATFTGSNTLQVDERTITARKYLIATGAEPTAPPIPGLDDAGFLTSTTAMELDDVPAALVVIGANAIGLELGQFFSNISTDVTYFDALDRIAPFEGPEISAALTQLLRDQGATIHCDAQITHVERDGAKKVVIASVDGQPGDVRVVVDEILVAIGRRANTAGLGADAAGIALTSGGGIEVDEYLGTTNPIVYAAGDVTSAPQFVFTTPQVAAAGLTERDAAEVGFSVMTSVLPLSAVPRALVNHDTTGLVKIVANGDTDKVVGVHMLADGAGDVIQAAVYAIKFGLTITDIADTWAPYLTTAEALRLAAQSLTRDVGSLSCCAA